MMNMCHIKFLDAGVLDSCNLYGCIEQLLAADMCPFTGEAYTSYFNNMMDAVIHSKEVTDGKN